MRQKYGPLTNTNTGKIDVETSKFIKPFAKRWKVKSIFQVLLLYRAARYQDFVNLTQQVSCHQFVYYSEIEFCIFIFQIHLYNQAVVGKLKSTNECMVLDKINEREKNPSLLGSVRQAVRKIPFRLDEIPFYDTSYMCDPINGQTKSAPDEDSDQEDWDAPLRRTVNISSHITYSTAIPNDSDANTENYER